MLTASVMSLSEIPFLSINSFSSFTSHMNVFLLPFGRVSSKSYLLFSTFLTTTLVASERVKRTGFSFAIQSLPQIPNPIKIIFLFRIKYHGNCTNTIFTAVMLRYNGSRYFQDIPAFRFSIQVRLLQ